MDKIDLRQRLLKERQDFTAAERQAMSAAIVGHLAAWLRGRDVDLVCAYHAVRGEPDLLPLASEWTGVIGLPVVGEVKGMMTFHSYRPGESLLKSSLGILEPDPAKTLRLMPTQRSVVIVPSVALDSTGARLGYGGGYYDRFLATFGGTTIGVVFHRMLVPGLPTQLHDVRLNYVATEQGVIKARDP